MATSVAVVVPCRNEAPTIGGLLDAVAAQTRPADEVLVVDDGSTDDTGRVIENWRRDHPSLSFKVIPGPGRGVAAAVNTGVAAATSAVVIRLDGHSIPAPEYIASSLAALDQPGVGVSGGVWQIQPGAHTLVARVIASVVAHPLGSGGAQYRTASAVTGGAAPVDTVPFGAFRRDLWQQIGGFDESLIANEDYDFNYRIRRAGSTVVLDPRIQSVYFARPTLAALARQYHRYGFWKAQMLRKHPRAVRWRQIPPAMVLPWMALTGVGAMIWPAPLAIVALAIYPTIVVAAGAHVAAAMKEAGAWPAASAALATVHLAWSAGFLRAALGFGAPDPSGRSRDAAG